MLAASATVAFAGIDIGLALSIECYGLINASRMADRATAGVPCDADLSLHDGNSDAHGFDLEWFKSPGWTNFNALFA